MESLALAAAVIVLVIMTLGVASVVIALRAPTKTWAKVLATLFSAPAVLAGGWLFLLEVGMGGRLMGLVVALVGGAALWRTWRTR